MLNVLSLPLDELEKRCPRIMTRTGKRADENNGTSGLRLAVQICPAAPKNPVAPAVTGFLLCRKQATTGCARGIKALSL